MSVKFYTGIGSRSAPPDILELFERFAARLEKSGYTLRSGGAIGSDSAFARGVKDPSKKVIYLEHHATNESMAIAAKIHPAWARCNDYARRLHGRNIFQVLGDDLNTKSDFVVCWTPKAKDCGGTRTAIVCARQNKIPIYNVADESQLASFMQLLMSLTPPQRE